MNLTPIDAALQWIDQLEAKKVRSDLEEWQFQALKLYRSGKVKTIDEGLGLAVGPGEAALKFCNVSRVAERNRLIREIGKLLDLPTMKKARVMSEAMHRSVPDVESREAQILLIKLRNLCQGSSLSLKEIRIYEIMNGKGCDLSVMNSAK